MNQERGQRAAEIAASLTAQDWLAPAVRREILSLNWEAAEEEAVQRYVGQLLPEAAGRADFLRDNLAGFREFVGAMAVPGAFEARLPETVGEDFKFQLAHIAATGISDVYLSVYVSLNVSTLMDGQSLLDGDDALDDWWIVKVATAARFDLQINAADSALASYAQFLGLASIDPALPPAELAEVLKTRVGPERGAARTEFFALLVRVLNVIGLRRHVLAATRVYFDYDGSDADSRELSEPVANLVARLRRFEQHASETVSEGFALGQLAAVADGWNTIIRGAGWATYQLIEAGEPDSEELIVQQWELLDAVVGWDLDSRWDPSQIEFLVRRTRHGPRLGCIPAWVESIEQRGLLDRLRRELVSGLQEFDSEESLSESWWQASAAVGRMAALGAVFDHLCSTNSPEAGFALLRECLADSDDWAWQLSEIAAAAPEPVSRWCAMRLIAGPTLLWHATGEFAILLPVLERSLRVAEAGGYGTQAFHDTCRQTFESVADVMVPDQLCHLLLAESLVRQGHGLAGSEILEAILGGLPPDPAFNLHRLNAIALMTPGVKDVAIGCVIRAMQFWNRLPALRPILEHEFGLPDVCHAPADELSGALRHYLTDRSSGQSQAARMDFVSAIAHAVEETNGPDSAARMWECSLGIEGLPDADLSAALREGETESWALVTLHVADSLFALNQTDRFLAIASVLCERDANDELHWLKFGARLDKLEELGPWVSRDTELALTGKILVALRLSGRRDLAVHLVQEELASLEWMPGEDAEVCSSEGTMLLGFEVARLLVENAPDLVGRLYDGLIHLVGGVYGYRVAMSYDRLAAAGRSAEARRTLIEIGNSLAISCNTTTANHRRVQNVVLDARLAQQFLLLRFLRGRPVLEVSPGPTLIPGNHARPTKKRIEPVRPEVRGRQSKFVLDRIDGSRPALGYDAVEREAVTFAPESGSAAWSEDVSEFQVAAAIGRNCVLLRAGFSLEGELVWSLFRSDGSRLALVSHDQRRGTREDRGRIAAALARFDRRVDSVWDVHESGADDIASQRNSLLDLRDALMDKEGFKPLSNQIHCHVAGPLDAFPRTRARFVTSFGEPGTRGDDGLAAAATVWERWWDDRFAALEFALRFGADIGAALDAATDDLLSELEAVWPIGELCRELHRTDELVVWVEGVLHGVPVAFLRQREGDGETTYLFEHVDTVRTVISPLLDSWMRQADEQADRDASGTPLIASLSWFGDRAYGERVTETRLNRLFSKLSVRYAGAVEWREAGGRSGISGDHDVLARGLRDLDGRTVALLTVCGHGHDSPHGVQLGDGVWDGSEVWSAEEEGTRWRVRGACNLSSIDFLIQLSCSIGRFQQTGYQDVDGFCAELFLNRARSVLAGRWPLHAGESIQFAGWVAEGYLNRHVRKTDGQSLSERRTRGRAVAGARRLWADRTRCGRSPVGLNTAAGMELYGLS